MVAPSFNLNPKAKVQGFSARFICLQGFESKTGQHPIRLQIIHGRKVKRYTTQQACTLEQWDEAAGRIKSRVKGAAAINGVLSAIEASVADIVNNLVVSEALNLDNFAGRYRNPNAAADVLAYLQRMEEGLRAEGRISYALMHRNAASALRRFSGGKPVRFAELTANKLERLEAYLKGEGCGGGGIATYMRILKVAVNRAIKEGIMHRDQYPFETPQTRGYSMKRLKSKANPRALTEDDMDKLKHFPVEDHPHLADSLRLFLFSYYARGINFGDLAHLKHRDVYDGRIHYHRRKTSDAFSIPVSQALADILDAFDCTDSPYLFPILSDRHATEKQQWDRIQKCLRKYNKDLKEVATAMGIQVPLTSYVARHTFATTLKRKGVDLAVISESMGHESVNTTRAYLKRFGSEVLDAADLLL
jgi:integrase/recombinase XerD